MIFSSSAPESYLSDLGLDLDTCDKGRNSQDNIL